MDTGEGMLGHVGSTAPSTRNPSGGLLNILGARSPRSGVGPCLAMEGTVLTRTQVLLILKLVRKHQVGEAAL